MATTTNLSSLVINYLTQAQYDAAAEGGTLNENQLYLTPSETLAAVATSGSYNDLSNKPTLATVATSGSYNDLSNKPTLATVATSGSYNDLSNKPAIYDLPIAASNTLGGIKTGYTTSGNNRAVQVDGNGNAYIIQADITNNITGTGTSGSIAKFNGTNSITDGPALGSSTSTYLRNDGTWQTPVGSFKNLGQNPVASDKYGLWKDLGSGWCFINTANLTTGQPHQWGIILNYVFGQEVHQIWMTQANGTCWERGYISGCAYDDLMPAWRGLNPTFLPLSLTVANWSNNSQTITATGVTTSNHIIVSPAPASIDNYTTAKIKCTAQAANSLTFTCETTPTAAISVNVLIIN